MQDLSQLRFAPRITMTALGAIAGGAMSIVTGPFFATSELFAFLQTPLSAWIFDVFVTCFFAVLLIAVGPLGLRRSVGAAAVISGVISGFSYLFGLRFPDWAANSVMGLHIVAVAVFLAIATPFAVVFLAGRYRWNDYAALFDAAWTIVVRYAAAWVFTGLALLFVALSNEILSLVNITVLETILKSRTGFHVLTGASLGLGLAVVYELRNYVSPFLVLRLLRLLLPVFFVVMVVFLVGLAVQGLNGVLGGLSAATTLLGGAVVGISLITTAIDKQDSDAARLPVMQWSAIGVALMLPLLVGLALVAIAMRIDQYGWTPARLNAVLATLFLAGYAVLYPISVLRKRDWMARIRRGNISMAVVALGVVLFWMSPAFHVERISTEDQIHRFITGKSTRANLPLREMDRDWGKAGRDGIERLKAYAKAQNDTALATAITQRMLSSGALQVGDDALLQLKDKIAYIHVGGAGGGFDPALLPKYQQRRLWQGCAPEIVAQRCLFIDQHDTSARGELRGHLFYERSGRLILRRVERTQDGFTLGGYVPLDRDALKALYAKALAGDLRLAPSRRDVLWIGDTEISRNN